MLNLVIALKLWARDCAHSAVKFYCDNLDVVQVVHPGKTRDNMLALCFRNIHFERFQVKKSVKPA